MAWECVATSLATLCGGSWVLTREVLPLACWHAVRTQIQLGG